MPWSCRLSRNLRILIGVLIFTPLHAEIDDRTRVALEALSRLKGADAAANPALKQAALRVAGQVRGEPEFVDLVRDFQLPGFEADLLDFAARNPKSPSAGEAVGLALDDNGTASLRERLNGAAPEGILEAVAAAADPRVVPLLQPLVLDPSRPVELRLQAVAALGNSSEGAAALLSLVRESKIPADLRPSVAKVLRAARWPEIRTAAKTLFPSAPKDAVGLPPATELLKQSGDATRGGDIFRRADVGCATCHQVNGVGVDFGPKLSEIGTKLGKDALLASLLDPSAGIAFGYEAWRIELKNGEELFGLVASETETQVTVKQAGGLVTEIKKADIRSREKQALSIMPAGLHENLTSQELVDLIEYLASLKRAAP